MNSPVERAKTALGVTTDTALAKALSVSQSVIGGYHRRQTVPLEQCIKISELTGVSLDWLILGKESNDNKPAVSHDDNDTGDAAFVPLYDVAASAGYGIFSDSDNEKVIQQVPFDRGWLHREGLYAKDLVCLKISGESMNPTLTGGDIVLINRAARHGDGVFVIRIGEMLRIKRLQWLIDGNLRISSDNSKLFNDEVVNPDDLENFEIIGICHTKIGRVS